MVINTEENMFLGQPNVSRPNVSRPTVVPFGRIPHYLKQKDSSLLDPNQFEIIVCKPGEKPFKKWGRYGIGLGYESV